MALAQRRPADVIHHSDQGTQYTSIAFGQRCREAGVRPSTGSVGDCFDNALCESFFATLECELLDRKRFETQAAARLAVFEFVEGWYNPHRRHSSIGYLSPLEFERRRRQVVAAAVMRAAASAPATTPAAAAGQLAADDGGDEGTAGAAYQVCSWSSRHGMTVAAARR